MSARGSNQLLAARAAAKRKGWLDAVRTEADERAMLDGCRYDRRRAEHVVMFGAKFLTLQDEHHGRPFELAAWQREQLFEPLYGWIRDDPEHRRAVRRFRRAYCQFPKKNGKSPIGSYCAAYALVGDGPNTRGAQCYSASTDKNQAGIVWNATANMVENSPALGRLLRVNRTNQNISRPDVHSFYRVLSSCPRRNEGWNASLIVCDELHKWAGWELWNALRWAFATRAEPLLLSITTAGDDLDGVCYQQYQYSRAVLAGSITDPRHFALIYEAEPGDDPAEESTWRKANPALGDYLPLQTFRADYEEAANGSSAEFKKWEQLRLNRWGAGADCWLPAERWDAGPDRRAKSAGRVDCFEPLEPAELAGRPSWGGLDLSLTTDLSAFVAAFPSGDLPEPLDLAELAELQEADPPAAAELLADYYARLEQLEIRLTAAFWLPEDTARARREQNDWERWAADGWVHLTDGSETDFAAIVAHIAQFSERHELRETLYDPMFATYLMQRLELEHGVPRREFRQTITNYAEPCKLFERFIRRRQFRHDGNPCFSWCVANTRIKEDDNGNLRPIKPKRGDPRRIDGTVAAVMAVAGALQGGGRGRTRYDTEDPRWV